MIENNFVYKLKSTVLLSIRTVFACITIEDVTAPTAMGSPKYILTFAVDSNSLLVIFAMDDTSLSLWNAVESGQVDYVKSLIQSGANLNSCKVVLCLLYCLLFIDCI